MKRFLVLASLLGAFASLPVFAAAADLNIEISGVRVASGKILLSLFNSADGYPEDTTKAFRSVSAVATQGTTKLTIPSVPAGTYAIVFGHDENGNGQIDRNALGIPKEGFGFSNDPSIGLSAPSFAKTQFEVRVSPTLVHMTMKHF